MLDYLLVTNESWVDSLSVEERSNKTRLQGKDNEKDSLKNVVYY